MRILKRKIALVQAKQERIESLLRNNTSSIYNGNIESASYVSTGSESQKLNQNTLANTYLAPQPSKAIKNVVKNFGRAICTFAASSAAKPYILDLLAKEEEIELRDFVEYVQKIKRRIDGLFHFRSLLLPAKNEGPKTTAYKRVFKEISTIFIKYFSVNWIFHSKVQYKQAHLKFRYKMLRRIQNPELFTYLQFDSGRQVGQPLQE
jgi:hypothetical protein